MRILKMISVGLCTKPGSLFSNKIYNEKLKLQPARRNLSFFKKLVNAYDESVKIRSTQVMYCNHHPTKKVCQHHIRRVVNLCIEVTESKI